MSLGLQLISGARETLIDDSYRRVQGNGSLASTSEFEGFGGARNTDTPQFKPSGKTYILKRSEVYSKNEIERELQLIIVFSTPKSKPASRDVLVMEINR
ncbi:hypothetical protein, partial [Chromohalobacter nigrandesensis]|uniref:hypothetical protein n=1 Tax=Chromohalobacter nigrandesensis TaxID=119863 RepID=UPI001FF4B309